MRIGTTGYAFRHRNSTNVSPVSTLDHHEDHAAPTVRSHISADSHMHFGSSQQRLIAVRLPTSGLGNRLPGNLCRQIMSPRTAIVKRMYSSSR